MKAHRQTVDLTQGGVWKTLLLYCLPLFGCAMVQQFYSLVDLLVVGNFAANGQQALTSIGEANVIINILLAFGFGANGGCSVIIAKYFGKKDYKGVKETVNTAVISFSVLCAIVMVIGFSCCRAFMNIMEVKQEFLADSMSYLNIYTASLPFIFMYNIGCGICSALGDSKTPFYFLILSSVLNIGLDLLFVIVFHWDVQGAAWATFISQTIASLLTLAVLIKKLSTIKVEEKLVKFNSNIFKQLVATAIPIILQNAFVSVGNFFVQKKINLIDLDGSAEAGFATAFKLVCMANMGVAQFTNGLSNFASQNKAAGKPERIRQGYIAVLTYAMFTSVSFAAIFIIFARPLTLFFIDNPTEGAVTNSIMFLTIVSSFLPEVCVKIVSDGCVRGCGGNLGFTVSTFTDLCLRVMFVYVLVDCGLQFAGVCWAWAIGWSTSMFIAIAFLLWSKELKGIFIRRKKEKTA